MSVFSVFVNILKRKGERGENTVVVIKHWRVNCWQDFLHCPHVGPHDGPRASVIG